MVSNITSRMLNLLGLLSAGVLLTQSSLVNAQSAALNANSSPSTTKPAKPAPAVNPPTGMTVPAENPSIQPPVGAAGLDSLKTPPTIAPAATIPGTQPEAAKPKTIVDLAAGNESFKTLTAAVKAAGLTTALASEGPFTVFAPTDKAFAALPAGVVEQLLLPENKPLLTKILSYHVVSGKLLAADLKSGELMSLQGSPIAVQIKTATAKATEPKATEPKATEPKATEPKATEPKATEPKATGNAVIPKVPAMPTVANPVAAPSTTVLINQAQVQLADVTASNGVIHAIDQVILPPDLMQKLRQSGSAPTATPKAAPPKAVLPKVAPKPEMPKP
jgi:uncharacterized surface protein with fasciclin (FAS1) repeats